MNDVLTLAVPCLVLAMLYCVWRAATLFQTWKPTVATVAKSGYGELDQNDDFWHIGLTIATRSGWNWRDGENARLIEDENTFTDDGGHHHRALIQRRVRRGWRPDNVYTIWYDPACPERVTAFGPGYWLLMAVVWFVVLGSVFSVGMKLGAH